MSEENPKTTIVSRIRDWVSAHPIVAGVIAGSAVVIACQVVTARACNNAELTVGDAASLEIEGEVAEE